MPYVSRPQYRQVEWGLEQFGRNIDLNPGASTLEFNECNLPTWTGTFAAAYLDFNLGTAINTFAGWNYVEGNQYIQIKNRNGTYTNAILIADGNFETELAPHNIVYAGRVYGRFDIKSKLEAAGSGGVIQTQWKDSESLNPDLYFRGNIQPILRVIFR